MQFGAVSEVTEVGPRNVALDEDHWSRDPQGKLAKLPTCLYCRLEMCLPESYYYYYYYYY